MTAKVIEFKAESAKDLMETIHQISGEIDESKKAWAMTVDEIKTAHADGDISLNTYIKWAVRFDYGQAVSPDKVKEIDLVHMANRWSYSQFNSKDKLKALELRSDDVLRVILILVEKGWFSFASHDRQIELDLFPQKE